MNDYSGVSHGYKVAFGISPQGGKVVGGGRAYGVPSGAVVMQESAFGSGNVYIAAAERPYGVKIV